MDIVCTYRKRVNMNLKQKKKKNDSYCNFCNFSLFIPSPNKFLVVCICILIFHGIYSPIPRTFFLLGVGANFFSLLVARGWEDFKFLGDLLNWEDLISFLVEGAMPFSSIKPPMTNHENARIVDGKIIHFICGC